MVYFENLMGLIIFTGSLFLMLLTVPWHEIKRFAIFGAVGGLGMAIIFILIMQNWLDFWTFHRVDFLYLGKIPFFLSAAWTPTEIFFAHFLNQQKNTLRRFLIIVSIPAAAVVIHLILMWNDMLTYHHWNLFLTFLVSVGIHAGFAYYLNRIKFRCSLNL